MSIPAKGVKGCLLYSPLTHVHFFRVYDSDDRSKFKDYELCAEDFDIEIQDSSVVLCDGLDGKKGKIDWSDKVLGKMKNL